MSEVSIFKTLAPYHILTYGTLLGSQVFQSFIGGIVAFRALPRPQFSSLQQKIFPIYFTMQTGLPVILALTYPGVRTALGTATNGISGTLVEANRWSVLAPLATIFVAGIINMAYVGPATTRIMKERKHQETKDGKKSYDPAPHSKNMQTLNKSFGRMHGISSLVNLVCLIATAAYGVTIAGRLD